MQTKPRSPIYICLFLSITIIIAFGCNLLSPAPALSPSKTKPTTEIVSTEVIPTQPPAVSQLKSTEFSIKREEKTYQITGSTEKALRQQLDKLGPLDKETGKRFDARTDWFIEWHYDYNESKKDCKIDSKRVDVSLSITFTYPKWTSPSSVTTALSDKWNTYMENLVLHEEGHVTIASDGAKAIYQTILDMPASPTCDALGEATNASAQEKINEIKQREKDYDNETGHGETQGAVFP